MKSAIRIHKQAIITMPLAIKKMPLIVPAIIIVYPAISLGLDPLKLPLVIPLHLLHILNIFLFLRSLIFHSLFLRLLTRRLALVWSVPAHELVDYAQPGLAGQLAPEGAAVGHVGGLQLRLEEGGAAA
jgi:hypothetical protein